MKPPVLQDLRPAAALVGFLGLLGWAFYLVAFYREPSQDWMVFYTAARAYWDGNLPLVFDGDRFTAVINDRFSTWLSWPLPPPRSVPSQRRSRRSWQETASSGRGRAVAFFPRRRRAGTRTGPCVSPSGRSRASARRLTCAA